MNKTIYVLILMLILTTGIQGSLSANTPKENPILFISETFMKDGIARIDRKIVDDSLIFYVDSLFLDLQLNLTEISKGEFQSFQRKYKTGCVLDTGRFIKGSGLYITHYCDEICETYLCERKTNRKMLVPSNFDGGIRSMLLSPDCHQMLVCSSYDGPDYTDYYEDRAEIFIFRVTTGIGLKGIEPAFKFFTKDWSIEDITWISNKSIALKIYEGRRHGDGSNVNYKYYWAEFFL